MSREISRWSRPIVTIVLTLTLLTGCAVNKGTDLAGDFKEDWAGTPDVAQIKTNGNNTLPFFGTATGTLILNDGTSAERMVALANELRKYVARHDSITGRITADGVTFTVVADQARTGEVLTLWQSMIGDHRVVKVDIEDRSRKEAPRWEVEVTAADARAGLEVFKDLVAEGGRHLPLSDVTSLEVNTGRGVQPGLFVETDYDGTLPTEAIAAYEAVAARYSIVRASLRTDRATIVVAGGTNLKQAGELAQRAAPTLGAAVEVTNIN